MAKLRQNPYCNFNFVVNLGGGDPSKPEAGFEEVVLPEMSIDVIEYRSGNAKENSVQKFPGLTRYSNVLLRRGLIGSLDLYQWINSIRNGDTLARRNVTVSLNTEDRADIAMTWKLFRAWPVKYRASALSGQGHQVVVEELELAIERLEIE